MGMKHGHIRLADTRCMNVKISDDYRQNGFFFFFNFLSVLFSTPNKEKDVAWAPTLSLQKPSPTVNLDEMLELTQCPAAFDAYRVLRRVPDSLGSKHSPGFLASEAKSK